jgi:hypothetical protein
VAHHIRWQQFKIEKEKVINAYINAKAKSVKALQMVQTIACKKIISIFYLQFRRAIDEARWKKKAAWAFFSIFFGFKRIIRRRYGAHCLDNRLIIQVKRNLMYQATICQPRG